MKNITKEDIEKKADEIFAKEEELQKHKDFISKCVRANICYVCGESLVTTEIEAEYFLGITTKGGSETTKCSVNESHYNITKEVIGWKYRE